MKIGENLRLVLLADVGKHAQTEHAVEAGDSLSLIAAIYSPLTDVGELKRLNLELVQKLREENPGGPIDDVPIPAEFTSVLVSLTWPAQLVYLNPIEPDTLLLSEIIHD